MKLIRVKKKDAKKCDLKPSQRIKVAGNVFVEVYKDNKGYFYRIDIPGTTDFVSKERYPHPDKASLAGRTHAEKFMKLIRGDEKKGDANPSVKMFKEAQALSMDVQNNGIYMTSSDIDKLKRNLEDIIHQLDRLK